MKHRQRTPGRHRPVETGRHRADEPLFGRGRHRAPFDAAERGRQVAATAALLAGVGIAGGSAAGAGQDAPPTADTVIALEARAAEPPASRSAARAPAAPTVPLAAPGTPVAQPAKKKAKPAPKKAAAPAWVDPMPSGRTTSCFGQRWGRLHAGVDLAAPAGTPVRAAGAGRVVQAGNWAGGYGISVLVEHPNGFLTHYAHLRERHVSVGDRVSAGEQLGEEGSTGNSTGPHLHFEVHRGAWRNPVEPTRWLADRGVSIPGCR
ncbi:M23 family metallopeptidase [Spirilliplanes yamanashiensis]|uniref:M23ase beta-sheet core domain-containing protein n=1 Tax=Spirilliplanes yamanashiensis TaxID=42233 RepID=A0A8J4DJ62_9ACTN|nr:M23 family metallopeptidase [Spirilliplanes yamanashiensis]MDP9815583.1 murein DD-endopeptidase MepM/ murein hydrolase activator NlpD [Spirilliplanes yamanashiensis]GIJ03837.1 hypothetical protein Sya03_31890 [Spirilliplanes yamanashiensis]